MGGTQYRLFGVTCHRGAELRFGHYTSYVRSPLGRWYQADDEDMSPVPLQQVISDKTAYLLSYIRVDGFESAQAQAHAQSRRESVGGQSNAKASPAVNGHASPVKRKRPLQEDSEDDGEDDNGDEDEDEDGDRPTKRGVPNGRYPSPAAPPSTPPRAPPPKLFSSAFDTPASETISSDNHATGLDSLPTKFGYQPKPKPKQQLQQSQQSQPVNILAPRPIPSKSFYGHEPSTTSPIARPGHPSPFAERADKHMSKKQRKKASKKELRKQRREDSRAGGGGAPKPYAVMHGGGNGGLGFASKKKGVVDRMQPKKRAL
jgi:ubiquitin carboxyl-terminal hydrolase 36/42